MPYLHVCTAESSSSSAYSPYSLTSASFRMIALTDLSSAFFLYLLTPMDFTSFSILVTLILGFQQNRATKIRSTLCGISDSIYNVQSNFRNWLIYPRIIFHYSLHLKYCERGKWLHAKLEVFTAATMMYVTLKSPRVSTRLIISIRIINLHPKNLMKYMKLCA
jgi:hypothetical protein